MDGPDCAVVAADGEFGDGAVLPPVQVSALDFTDQTGRR